MGKLSEKFNNLKEKWKELSKGKKMAYSIIPVGVIAAIIAIIITANSNKYAVLFSDMNQKDMGAVLTKLKEKKTEYKVKGNVIQVPKEKVDELRLELASEVSLTNGSIGFEIFDDSKFGMTDEEMKIKYQRALEGELERTFKSLPQVENAKVHLVMPEDSVFVKDSTPASASVTLKIKEGKDIKKDEVKAMVALMCSSVKNLDKKDVEIVAANKKETKLLTTKDLFKENEEDYVTSTENQEKIKSKVEKELEEKLQVMLEKVYGKSNVAVSVNADLNFDAIQNEDTEYAPKGTIVSEHIIKDNSKNQEGTTSNSPVDNNMSNRGDNNSNNSNSNHEEQTRNFEVSKSQKKTIVAPGAVRKMSTSVLLNGNLDQATRNSIRNLVIGTIGFDEQRGDNVSIEGINFDTSLKDRAKNDLNEMKKKEEETKKKQMYTLIGILAAIVAIILFFVIKNRRNKQEEMEEFEEEEGIDTIIGDNIEPKETKQFEPINFEEENEMTHTEKEIKKYAKEKPEQVAEIIKSWLAEDER